MSFFIADTHATCAIGISVFLEIYSFAAIRSLADFVSLLVKTRNIWRLASDIVLIKSVIERVIC